jgi:hypothetical protein
MDWDWAQARFLQPFKYPRLQESPKRPELSKGQNSGKRQNLTIVLDERNYLKVAGRRCPAIPQGMLNPLIGGIFVI